MSRFERSIAWSVGGHLAIMLLAIYGLPNIREHKVETVQSIAIDVIDISDALQKAGEIKAAEVPAPRKSPEQAKEPAKEPQKETPKPPVPVVPPQPKVQPQKPDPKDEEEDQPEKPVVKPVAKPEPKPLPKPKEDLDPDALMKKINEAQEKPKPKPVEKPVEKPTEKPVEKPQEKVKTTNSAAFDPNKLSQLLNKDKPSQTANNTPSKPTQVRNNAGGVENSKTTASTKGAPQGLGAKLNQSQYAALQNMIREQVSNKFSPPPGGIEGAPKVRLAISVNPDGSVSGMPRILNSSNEPNFRAVAEAAQRAVRRASPLKLPPEQYNSENGWKEIEFIFDPSQI